MKTPLGEQASYPVKLFAGQNDGINIRTLIAKDIMCALLKRGDIKTNNEKIAAVSVSLADALLTALSQEPLNSKQ